MVKKKRKLLLSLAVLLGILLDSHFYMVKAHAQTNEIIYKVKKGDTFYLLGLRFNTNAKNISSMNPRINPSNLRIDSKIKLPTGSGLYIHHIQKGDTLGKIARKYNSTVSMIATKNYIKNPNLIYAGDYLAINKTADVITQISGIWKSTNTTKWSGTEVVITPTGTNTFNIHISAYHMNELPNGYENVNTGDMDGKGTIMNDKIHFIVDENMSGDISLQNEKLLITYNGPINYQAGASVWYETDFIRK